MAERSNGGMSASALMSSARTRPTASVRATSSAPRRGVCLRTISSASSTVTMGRDAVFILARCGMLRSSFRMSSTFFTVQWEDDAVVLIDQRRLPDEEVYLRCRDHREVAEAIRGMAIRGAPAIGVAAAMGLALGVRRSAET